MGKTLKITLNIIAGLLVIAAFVALIFTQKASAEEIDATRDRLNYTCSKSLDDLVTLSNELKNALAKVQVVNSQNQYTLLLSEIWRSSAEAVNALGTLPSNFSHVSEANAFLVQTGDYAHSLLEKTASGQLPTQEDKNQLTALYQSCTGLVDKLEAAREQGVDFAGLIESCDYYGQADTSWLQLGSSGGSGNASADADVPAAAGSGSQNTDNQNQDQTTPEKMYPTLIYDGPFSDSTEKAEAKGLGAGELDEAAANAKAKEFLGDLLSGELAYEGLQQGKIPVHSFKGTSADGRTIDIEITVTGGHCLSMRMTDAETQSTQAVGETQSVNEVAKPDEETGKKLAQIGKDFLKSRGFDSMESTYAQYYGGTAVINYAFVQDGTLLYSDLIKVWVDVETGAISGMEAQNYFFSHVQRNIPVTAVSEADARAKLSPDLTVVSVRMALIPKTINDERLCYEFKCTYMDESYIVYVNAVNGSEEQVYKIIDSDKGQLVV